MRQSRDFKKQFKLLLISILAIFIVPVFFSYGDLVTEVQNKISQKNQEIAELEKQIASFQKELNSLGKQKTSLNNAIKELDLTQKKLKADIAITESKISKKNLEIENLDGDISSHEEQIYDSVQAVSIDFRKIYQQEQNNMLYTLLSNKDFTSAWNDIDSMLMLREKIVDRISVLRTTKSNLEDTKQETIQARNELNELRVQLADQQKLIEQNKNEKNQLLKKTKNSEANYQKMLKTEQKKMEDLEREVEEYESQLKYILNPESLPSGRVLSWPLEKIYVTQLFGKTEFSGRLYASGTHSGVDFRAAVGTPVYSMADGVIAGIGDTDQSCPKASFGKWVLIKYDNGLASAYGHLSLTKVANGQKVKRGELVAYSGNTGRTTGPHLHVTVYAGDAVEVRSFPSKSCVGKNLTQPMAAHNAYLDPMVYLPPYE